MKPQQETATQTLDKIKVALMALGYSIKYYPKNCFVGDDRMQIRLSLKKKNNKTKEIYFKNNTVLIKWAMNNNIIEHDRKLPFIIRKGYVKTFHS